MQTLKCDRRTHARATEDGAIEIHCRYCSRLRNEPVFHWWKYDAGSRVWISVDYGDEPFSGHGVEITPLWSTLKESA